MMSIFVIVIITMKIFMSLLELLKTGPITTEDDQHFGH